MVFLLRLQQNHELANSTATFRSPA